MWYVTMLVGMWHECINHVVQEITRVVCISGENKVIHRTSIFTAMLDCKLGSGVGSIPMPTVV